MQLQQLVGLSNHKSIKVGHCASGPVGLFGLSSDIDLDLDTNFALVLQISWVFFSQRVVNSKLRIRYFSFQKYLE